MTLRFPSLRLLGLGCLTSAALALSAHALAADEAAKKPLKPRAKATRPAPASSIRLQGFGGGAAPTAMPGSTLSLPGSLAATDAGEDYIVAVVDKELVTNSEVQARVARIVQDAQNNNAQLPARDALVGEVLELLISEKAQLVAARDSGLKVDAAEIDRAVQGVATQNQITVAQLGQQLRKEGMDMARLREQLRDQILLERLRDRELAARVRVTDAEVDAAAERLAKGGGGPLQLNLAHLLIALPENATPAQVAEATQLAESLLARARAGEPFDALVKRYSASKAPEGGVLGLRPVERLPEPFVAAVRNLQPGEVAPQWLRSDAGLHLIKLVERQAPDAAPTLAQTHARHILLRISPQLGAEAAQAAARALQARHRGRQGQLCPAGPRALAGRQRPRGRRPGLGGARHVRAGVRIGDERTGARADLRSGGLALRGAPDPAHRATQAAHDPGPDPRGRTRAPACAEERTGLPGVGAGNPRPRLHRTPRPTPRALKAE